MEEDMYLVAYDITDDRERRLVSRLLDGYGYSLQRSLYICHIHASQARRICRWSRSVSSSSDGMVGTCAGGVRKAFLFLSAFPDNGREG